MLRSLRIAFSALVIMAGALALADMTAGTLVSRASAQESSDIVVPLPQNANPALSISGLHSGKFIAKKLVAAGKNYESWISVRVATDFALDKKSDKHNLIVSFFIKGTAKDVQTCFAATLVPEAHYRTISIKRLSSSGVCADMYPMEGLINSFLLDLILH